MCVASLAWSALFAASATVSPRLGEAALGCEAPYPLTELDPQLSNALRDRLTSEGFGDWIEAGTLAVGFVDLSVEPPRMAAVAPNRMLYAASLPKIVLLLGLIREGRSHWTAEMAERCESMICRSSNRDATWAFDQLGLDRLEQLVRAPGLCFYGNRDGGLWVGRAYGRGRPARRDPVHGISHGATVRQVLRFYTLLDRGLLGDPESTRRIWAAMGPPRQSHKFVHGLRGRKVRFLARKSGTWRDYHSDSAVIEHRGRRYAAVALVQHPDGARAVTASIRIMDDLVVRP